MDTRTARAYGRPDGRISWWERSWIGAVLVLVALTGFGALPDLWPFHSWTMFSSVASETSDYLVVVAVDDGERSIHREERLPGGYVRDGYLHRFEHAGDAQREAECQRMLADLRAADGSVAAVELERWEWVLLPRTGERPDGVDREVVWRCEP